jgi:hypothetical protein
MGLLRSARGLNISSLTSQIKRCSWNFVAHCGCYPSVATSAFILKLDCFQILGLNGYTLPVKVTEAVWRFEPQRYLMLMA